MHNIRIKTERLLLRPLSVADAQDVFEWVGDERVAKYMVYTTYTDVEQVKKCGLHFVGYGEFQKLDGSCKMCSMEYEGCLE